MKYPKPLLYPYTDDNCKVVYFPNGDVYTNFAVNSVTGTSVFYENWPNGQLRYIEFRLNGKMDNGTKPAKVGYYKDGRICSESYYVEGKLHRDAGPAWIKYSEDGSIRQEWWNHGMVKDAT